MKPTSRVYVAGGDTLLGAALLERLQAAGYQNLVGLPPDEPDLTVAGQVEDFFAEARPDYVFVTAGKSGGIQANQTFPAELMLHNLLVTAHVLQSAHAQGVEKLLYLASSCCYPREAPQPLRVEALMTGPLEPTNEAYATAKLAGMKLCAGYRRQNGAAFIAAVPANSFGPNDEFRPDRGHVIPALIHKLHQAKLHGDPEVVLWGTGAPQREFIYSKDLADACLFVMKHYDEAEPLNLGGGSVLSIAEAARVVAEVVGYEGRLRFDPSRPDGMPFKALDTSKLRALGWQPATSFRAALEETYDWYLHHVVTEDAVDVPAAL
jgi:GDP-L-fucose synthase